jgi:anti-anti-sigma factor
VVCLSGVTFIDSSVIHALCASDRTLHLHGGRLVVYTERRSVAERVLELCRLKDRLLFGDTLEQAIGFARQAAEPTAPA